MDIIIIGSGNVASVLGRKFKSAGHNIIQVYSRNASEASKLAYEWDTESTNYKSLINNNADVYIIAVADDAIVNVADNLKLPGKVVAHTAASVPKEVLKEVTSHYGVFYPLQSLRKEMTSLPTMPIFFDGSDEQATKALESLAHSIADKQAVKAGDTDRMKLHLAAVFVSNFTNHLYVLAEQYCRKEGLDFKQLLPLIEETASRIRTLPPQLSQTGPALRHDKATIEKHLELLNEHPHLKNIYLVLTESIQQMS
jgi:predicted short-subunit dehydrogenase-like oxidoreductase (DUF2520 family)